MKNQKTLGGEFEPDHARYRKASEPHESPKASKEAMKAFCKELAELRVKHKVKDLYVIYNVAQIEKDGRETSYSGMTGFGTQSLWVSMTACAYGAEKANHEQNIRRMLSQDE